MPDRVVSVPGLITVALLLAAPLAASAQAPPPTPYSLPWQLRPVTAGTVVRVDETVASFKVPATNLTGSTAVTSFLASAKLGSRLAPVVRIAVASNEPPAPQAAATAVSNPLLGITYARPFGAWRGAAFVGATLPVGQGGGSNPDPARAAAMSRAIGARSAMDNALFAVNFWVVVGGLDAAYVNRNLTVQFEATVLRLTRAPVRRDASARQTVTMAIGPRAHFKLAGGKSLRPGIAWAHVLDDPLARESYDMLQLDVPLSF